MNSYMNFSHYIKINTLVPFIFSVSLCIVAFDVSYGQSTQILTTEEKEVMDIVHLFFKSMTERDTITTKAILTNDGQYYALREEENGLFQRTVSHKDYIKRLGSQTDLVQERIWDPLVNVHKRIAMVWAPYDIYINGNFLHCGVDSFSLIKTEEGWKIAGVVFTMEPEGCEESPLEPLNKN